MGHSYYQLRGGEDVVFETERDALRASGHIVVEYVRRNVDLRGRSSWQLARDTVWSSESYEQIRRLIRTEKPEVAHFHNTLPLLSPAAYYACRDEGVPVVQTLHNYRTMCLNALLYRQGALCERCVGKRFAWPGVALGCYRNSRSASFMVASMLWYHWRRGTWRGLVDRYLCLTQFSIDMHRTAGLPQDRLTLKRNFLPDDPGFSNGASEPAAIFVGRLSPEKGVDFLLDAWVRSDIPFPIRIVGDGSLRAALVERYSSDRRVAFLGGLPRPQVLARLADASVLIVSSRSYEGFPMTILESLSVGTPVLAPRMGGMVEVPSLGAGATYEPGNGEEMILLARRVIEQSLADREARQRARKAFEDHFCVQSGIDSLVRVYSEVAGQPRTEGAS